MDFKVQTTRHGCIDPRRFNEFFNLQLKPSKRPNSKTSSDDNKWTKKASQLFVKEFGGCPNGMIPVRRSRGGISTGSPVANVQSQSAGSQTHYVHQVSICEV